MTSWATVQTTVSESAVEIRNQIASRVPASATPNQRADSAHVFQMNEAPDCRSGKLPGHDPATGEPRQESSSPAYSWGQ